MLLYMVAGCGGKWERKSVRKQELPQPAGLLKGSGEEWKTFPRV